MRRDVTAVSCVSVSMTDFGACIDNRGGGAGLNYRRGVGGLNCRRSRVGLGGRRGEGEGFQHGN